MIALVRQSFVIIDDGNYFDLDVFDTDQSLEENNCDVTNYRLMFEIHF